MLKNRISLCIIFHDSYFSSTWQLIFWPTILKFIFLLDSSGGFTKHKILVCNTYLFIRASFLKPKSDIEVHEIQVFDLDLYPCKGQVYILNLYFLFVFFKMLGKFCRKHWKILHPFLRCNPISRNTASSSNQHLTIIFHFMISKQMK